MFAAENAHGLVYWLAFFVKKGSAQHEGCVEQV